MKRSSAPSTLFTKFHGSVEVAEKKEEDTKGNAKKKRKTSPPEENERAQKNILKWFETCAKDGNFQRDIKQAIEEKTEEQERTEKSDDEEVKGENIRMEEKSPPLYWATSFFTKFKESEAQEGISSLW
jgi:hypothetical protein